MPIKKAAAQSVSGSSTRKPKVNLDNTYGISLKKPKGKSAVTQTVRGSKTTVPAAKRKVLG